MIIVQPENSESQRRIGAKGTNCILHIAPWGVTLALQSTRSVLAQWPLKSVRYFEASGHGKFMLEAGRVAPMGDGMYVFQTQKGKDNYIYDLLDQHIVNALSKTQVRRNSRGKTLPYCISNMDTIDNDCGIGTCLFQIYRSQFCT